MVSGLAAASAIAAGYYHTCAIVAGGEGRYWGRDDHGWLGDGTRWMPTAVMTDE